MPRQDSLEPFPDGVRHGGRRGESVRVGEKPNGAEHTPGLGPLPRRVDLTHGVQQRELMLSEEDAGSDA